MLTNSGYQNKRSSAILAQLVERLTRNEKVPGANPGDGSQ